MDLAEQSLIVNSHHHDYASTQDIKSGLVKSSQTEASYSDTSALVCFYKTMFT